MEKCNNNESNNESCNTNNEVDTAFAQTLQDFKSRLDEEHALRVKAENDLISLTKLLRTMPMQNAQQEEKKETAEESLKNLFND